MLITRSTIYLKKNNKISHYIPSDGEQDPIAFEIFEKQLAQNTVEHTLQTK